jgi:hypothetical protein
MSAEEALQAVTLAVTTGNTRILRQVGITTGATEAYDRYASYSWKNWFTTNND